MLTMEEEEIVHNRKTNDLRRGCDKALKSSESRERSIVRTERSNDDHDESQDLRPEQNGKTN